MRKAASYEPDNPLGCPAGASRPPVPVFVFPPSAPAPGTGRFGAGQCAARLAIGAQHNGCRVGLRGVSDHEEHWRDDLGDEQRFSPRHPEPSGQRHLGPAAIRVDAGRNIYPGSNATFNFTVTAPTAPGTYNFQFRMVHEAVAWFGDYTPNLAIPATNTPDFKLSITPTQYLFYGSYGDFTVTATPVNGFTGAINFTLPNPYSGMDFGWLGIYTSPNDPYSVTVGCKAYNYPYETTYSTTVQATSGSLTHTVTAVAETTDFYLTPSGSPQVAAGFSGSTTITITPYNGYEKVANNTIGFYAGSLPFGITASLNPQAITPTTPAASTTQMSLSVSSAAAPGRYTIPYYAYTYTGHETAYVTLLVPPNPPLNLTVLPGNAKAALRWTLSPGATSYNVKRSTGGGAFSTISAFGTVTGATYTDFDLANGTAYTYEVTAVCSGGESAVSNTAAATPLTDEPSLMGSGNLHLNDQSNTDVQLAALKTADAGACRIVVEHDDYQNASPPPSLDSLMQSAHNQGITPILHFEYYSGPGYVNSITPSTVFGLHQWYNIGQAFAARYAPNSAWWSGQRIHNYGVSIYEAINEPDNDGPGSNDYPPIDTTSYHDALKDLAEGVHAVNPRLKINPGGFSSPNAGGYFDNGYLNGYGAAIADLWNDGHLDGIDLHTYINWMQNPADSTDQNGDRYSAQAELDAVKYACGITALINFYSTEFGDTAQNGGLQYNNEGISEDDAAERLLTYIWDELGIVKSDGSPACKLALAWSLFDTIQDDPATHQPTGGDTSNGMCFTLDPWTPSYRGSVYQLVAQLTAGMSVVASDPTIHEGGYFFHNQDIGGELVRSGTVVLNGGGKKMWVWQNRVNWTNNYQASSASFTIANIPATATQIAVYRYNSTIAAPYETVSISPGQLTCTITSLPVATTTDPKVGASTGETYMFVANAQD